MEDIYKTDIFKKTEPTFLSGLKSLFTTQPTKQLLYNIQYNTLTLLVGIIIGSVLDYSFPVYNRGKETYIILLEVIIQIIIISISIYYIPKVTKLVPYIGNTDYNFVDCDFNIILTLCFVASQINLLKKIQHVIKVLKNKYSRLNTKITSSTSAEREEARRIVKQFMRDNPGVISVNNKVSAANVRPPPNDNRSTNIQSMLKPNYVEQILPNKVGEYPREKGLINPPSPPPETGFSTPFASNQMSNMSNNDYSDIANSMNFKIL